MVPWKNFDQPDKLLLAVFFLPSQYFIFSANGCKKLNTISRQVKEGIPVKNLTDRSSLQISSIKRSLFSSVLFSSLALHSSINCMSEVVKSVCTSASTYTSWISVFLFPSKVQYYYFCLSRDPLLPPWHLVLKRQTAPHLLPSSTLVFHFDVSAH